MASDGPTTGQLVSMVNDLPRMSEAAKVTTVSAIREDSQGHSYLVKLEIYDQGTPGDLRWKIVATDEHGNATSGNSMDNLQAALSVVHWERLGQPK